MEDHICVWPLNVGRVSQNGGKKEHSYTVSYSTTESFSVKVCFFQGGVIYYNFYTVGILFIQVKFITFPFVLHFELLLH